MNGFCPRCSTKYLSLILLLDSCRLLLDSLYIEVGMIIDDDDDDDDDNDDDGDNELFFVSGSSITGNTLFIDFSGLSPLFQMIVSKL